MARRHTQAVKARIEEIPALTTKTRLGIAPRNENGSIATLPLALIHPAGGIDEADRLTGPRTVQRPRFTLHLVGSSVDNVETIRDLVKAKFIQNGYGTPPAVTGEVTSALTWEEPTPIQDFREVTPHVYYAVIELSFTAEPAG